MPSKSLFPQPCGSSTIKSHWPPKSNSLGVLCPFAGSPGWEIFVGLTTFLIVREFLWYNCSTFCGWRNNSRKNEEMELKQKQHPVVDVTGDRSKLQCYKEQYCIGIWNVRSTKQGKLEVVKQKMARVNINILGISELK